MTVNRQHTEHKSLHEVTEQAEPVEAPETKVKVLVKNWTRLDDGTLIGPAEDGKPIELDASVARRLGSVYVEPVE